MCAGVGFMMETRYEPRRERRVDGELVAFYAEVFGPGRLRGELRDELREPLPRRIEVADIEGTLARVWDSGGTIVSTFPDGDGLTPRRATFRDPRGNLVAIARCE
jgi:hypothetical protein